jgi:TRAP-type C4-dicarboxylate transport system permease small subunit
MTDTSERASGHDGVVGRIGDALARVCVAIAAGALLCIVAINGVNVVARYFFGSPFSWAEELMLYLMILGVFTGGIAATWRNLHIRIDTIIEQTPPAIQRIAKVLVAVISIGIIAIVTVASFRIVAILQSFDQRSDALQIPIWIPQSFVTIGLALMALLIAVKLATSRTR